MPKKIVVDLDQVGELAAQGKTQAEAADALGLKETTFHTKMKMDDEFRGAWNEGRARAAGEEVAAETPPAAEPEAPSRETDAARVMAAVATGIKCRAEFRELTGLNYAKINDALYDLVVEGKVEKVEGRLGKEYYRVKGSVEMPPTPGPATEGGPPAQGTEAVPDGRAAQVSSRPRRAAKKVGARKPGARKAGKAAKKAAVRSAAKKPTRGPRRTCEAPAPAPVSAAPPYLTDSSLKDDAIRAATAELTYAGYWGQPSPRHGEVMKKLRVALGE